MSTIRVDNFGPSAGGTTYSARGIAKAWVNFDGTGTIAARDSENVSSLTDNGTGDYTVNIGNDMADENYSFAGGGNASGSGDTARGPVITQHTTMTSSVFRFYTNRNGDNGAGPVNLDYSIVCVNFHGDLA
jgi:hypothetical protein